MIEVKTAELIGPALDWAVAKADGRCLHERIRIVRYNDDSDHICEDCGKDTYMEPSRYSWKPSTDWSQGGPLIDKYGVLLSPPKSLMHVNGGPNAGWRETGAWGSTIFGTERKHRRKAFEHQDQPLVAAMRAIVQFELGDAVSVPAELVQQPTEGSGDE